MYRALSLGRVVGIDVGVHPTWLLVYALVTWSLSTTMDDVPRGLAYALSATCALLLFASVVVHEFAHALVARRFGVATRAITLFLFGGVATLEREPPTPRAEIAIALAGPAMSGVLALGAGAIMLALDQLGSGTVAAAAAMVVSYVALANVAIALFNLIPAFPMDGGRVLRAVLWLCGGRRAGATAISSLVGLGFAALVIAGGAFALVGTGVWQSAWYLVLGTFLGWMSWRNYRAARRLVRVERMRVGDVMEADAALVGLLGMPFDGPALAATANGLDALDLFRATACTHIPVVSDGLVTGVLARTRVMALAGEPAA